MNDLVVADVTPSFVIDKIVTNRINRSIFAYRAVNNYKINLSGHRLYTCFIVAINKASNPDGTSIKSLYFSACVLALKLVALFEPLLKEGAND